MTGHSFSFFSSFRWAVPCGGKATRAKFDNCPRRIEYLSNKCICWRSNQSAARWRSSRRGVSDDGVGGAQAARRTPHGRHPTWRCHTHAGTIRRAVQRVT
ncbi:hypothetical protein EYF80_061770 [Liparis tanakae]|uniref:Uncharacterized protein n=1 Tax=Liparis tanakae TaxID=230148 RepID=A0A4Z2EIA3_9TELE|nr:hypothetical protein EYF80_061770 [Liparis tanakae]